MAVTEEMIVRLHKTEDFDGVYNYVRKNGEKLDPVELSQALEITLPLKEHFLKRAIRKFCYIIVLSSVVPFLNIVFAVVLGPRLLAQVSKYGRQVAVLGHSDPVKPERIRHICLMTGLTTNAVYSVWLLMCFAFHRSLFLTLLFVIPNLILSGTWPFVWDIHKYLNTLSQQRKCLFSPYNRRWWKVLKNADNDVNQIVKK